MCTVLCEHIYEMAGRNLPSGSPPYSGMAKLFLHLVLQCMMNEQPKGTLLVAQPCLVFSLEPIFEPVSPLL